MAKSIKPKTIKDLASKKLEKKAEQVKGGAKTRGGDDDLDDLEVERRS